MPCAMYNSTLIFSFSLLHLHLIILLISCPCYHASNWAQVSGIRGQNIASNLYPSASHPHWQPRYGHTVVNYYNVTIFNDLGAIIIMGGDTYDVDYQESNHIPNLFDYSYGNGYKNDVWKMSTADWLVVPDRTGFLSSHGQKMPRTRSTVTWKLLSAGLLPLPRITYESWIICQEFFSTDVKYAAKRDEANCSTTTAGRDVMWSPRRHHTSVVFQGYIYVMGGRARELVEFSEDVSVGGIIGPRVKDVDPSVTFEKQYLTTQREASIVKSDVWRSQDGVHWELMTPGCRAPQSGLVPDGNDRDRKYGKSVFSCINNADCYGAESCDTVKQTCVCTMWSSREQHALAVHGNYMYISGGYASLLYSKTSACGPYPCGDTDASSYRHYMNDIWRSSDGIHWESVNTSAAFSGRGGHQMLVIPDSQGDPFLYILGGRGGDNSGMSSNLTYFNDVWVANLTGDYPALWVPQKMATSAGSPNSSYTMPWEPRLGHTVTLDPATAANGNARTIYLVGGQGVNGMLDDVWVWRPDDGNNNTTTTWIQDFSQESLYSTVYNGRFGYFNSSPLVEQYITPDSDISLMQRYFVPSYPIFYPGRPLEKRVFLSNDQITMLRSVGINTINDFAQANKYAILKLRGFDVPQVPLSERLKFNDVCDKRTLAIALVKKCSLTTELNLYYDESSMPWNVKNIFGGPPPQTNPAAWHGVDYNALRSAAVAKTKIEVTAEWDGCSQLSGMAQSGYGSPNVIGIGLVSQVGEILNPFLELEELSCRQTPGKRAYHTAISYQEKLFIFGGKTSETKLNADAWYRDSTLPTAFILTKPNTRTSDSSFVFSGNKPGCFFEYRIWDPANYRLIREWTPVVFQTDVAWMDSRKNGPGTGLYAMYVRAIDPAGNRDVYFSEGFNVYTWIYVSPTPWDIIFGSIGGFIGLCILLYLEYRRRRKKAAMERYALKRMRRKFKAMQKEADDKGTDWRTLYEENKQESTAAKRKKMLKRARDANKERLEKDATRRDKEKDAIKIKMKEKKELMRKKRLNDGGQYGFGERNDEDLETGSQATRNKVISPEDVEAPSRVKKSKDRRKKPGGYDAKAYEEQAPESNVGTVGNMDEGIKKRKKADKRTKEFEVAPEDEPSQNPKKET